MPDAQKASHQQPECRIVSLPPHHQFTMAVFAPLQQTDKENRPVSSGNGCIKPVQTRRRSRSSFSGPYVKTAVIGKTFESAKPSPRTRQVQLPKTLPRPIIATPDFDTLAEVEPELEGVPSQYIIDKLEALRARYILSQPNISHLTDLSARF